MSASTLSAYDLRTDLRTSPREVDTESPLFTWRLRSTANGDDQTAYRVVVDRLAPAGAPGDEVWDSGWVESREVRVRYGGAPLTPFASYRWMLRVRGRDGGQTCEVATFETGALSGRDWAASWIGRSKEHVLGLVPPGVTIDRSWVMHMAEPALRVRRSLSLPAPPVRARLYTSAHGVYRPFVNGNRVGDDELAPGWTEYRKRVQYRAHDVTDLLAAGENVIGMVVGDGWWSGCVGYDVRRHSRHYGARPHAFAQLVVDLADGVRIVVGTDDSWSERPGEVVYSDLLMGECQDLTLRDPTWCMPGAGSVGWRPAVVYDRETSTLVGQIDEPVGVVERLVGKVVSDTPERVLIDFGQNLGGRVSIAITGVRPRQPIRIRHGEMLHEGELFTENLRSAEATDIVVPDGETVEFEPWFTFHGFRYAEVSGLPEGASITRAEGVVVSSRLADAGTLETSHPLVDRLVSNIRWSQRGNFVSVPTDCPQRDERLGWTADAQVFTPTAAYLSDVEGFFGRWLLDLRDDQLPNGSVPDVVPLPPPVEIFDFGAPGWGDAATIVPWHLYRTYGDRELLARQYPSMTGWVDYVTSRAGEGLWDSGLGNNYGDWLGVDEETDRVLVSTAYRARSLDLVSRAARTLGRHDDAAVYSALADGVRTAFRSAFLDGDRLRNETQSAYLFALAWRLVPDELRRPFADRLSTLIRERGNRLSTGFLGVGLLCPVLTEVGETTLAFDLLFQTEYPSWGYSIEHGATTIWERWDGWTEHAGFQAATMNSFNHYSLGSVGEWLFRSVGGIDQAAEGVGFDELVIHPRYDARLDYVRASYTAPRGRVRASWERVGDVVHVEVEVPPGAGATAPFLTGSPRLGPGEHRFSIPLDVFAGAETDPAAHRIAG